MRFSKGNSFCQHQADVYLAQANPVSGILYTVLDTMQNVRILGIACDVAWVVTQPTPLEIVMTIDGQVLTFVQANPVSGSFYFPWIREFNANNALDMSVASQAPDKAFLIEGKSLKIEVRITWAITQPTPLEVRVKWARLI